MNYSSTVQTTWGGLIATLIIDVDIGAFTVIRSNFVSYFLIYELVRSEKFVEEIMKCFATLIVFVFLIGKSVKL